MSKERKKERKRREEGIIENWQGHWIPSEGMERREPADNRKRYNGVEEAKKEKSCKNHSLKPKTIIVAHICEQDESSTSTIFVTSISDL